MKQTQDSSTHVHFEKIIRIYIARTSNILCWNTGDKNEKERKQEFKPRSVEIYRSPVVPYCSILPRYANQLTCFRLTNQVIGFLVHCQNRTWFCQMFQMETRFSVLTHALCWQLGVAYVSLVIRVKSNNISSMIHILFDVLFIDSIRYEGLLTYVSLCVFWNPCVQTFKSN